MKIIIVGGGSSGWMSAATLIKLFPEHDITLIESPNIATVGVGESTLGTINDWLKVLEIKDEDFMAHCDASYKLSIRFEDFYEKGDGGFHYPFGIPFDHDLIFKKQLWFYKKALYDNVPNSNYADFVYPQMALVHQNKLSKTEDFSIPGYRPEIAYHFDATKFGLWLRDHYCIPRGVKHIQEDISSIETSEDGIESLNKKHKADLYLDCTGFSALLIDKTLGVPFKDYTDLLPNNSAWATRIPYTDKESELQPYTNCTAIENGWVWNIPIWTRVGTGYVYSDKHISDEDALEQFKNYLEKTGKPTDNEYKNIKMRVGIHEELFYKNVCAIGLSAGFIEPLESNGLLTVHKFLIALSDVLKRGTDITQFDRDSFNEFAAKFFNSFTDFVALHYALSNRSDTQYWKDVRNKRYLSVAKSNDIRQCIMDRMDENYAFDNTGIHCISTGMNYYGVNRHITDDIITPYKDQVYQHIQRREMEVAHWNNLCKKHPSLYEYLKENIHGN